MSTTLILVLLLIDFTISITAMLMYVLLNDGRRPDITVGTAIVALVEWSLIIWAVITLAGRAS